MSLRSPHRRGPRGSGIWLLATLVALGLVGPVDRASGQQAQAGRLEVILEPRSVTVGDRVAATVELTLPAGAPASEPRFPVWGERWGDTEVLDVGPVERLPALGRGAGLRYRQRLVLVAFRPGSLALPPRTVAVPGAETTHRLATPDGLALEVRSVLPPPDGPQMPNEGGDPGRSGTPSSPEPPDPKPAAAPRPLPVPTAFWWALAALGLPSFLAFLALARRRARESAQGHGPSVRAPADELSAALAAARREPSTERGHTLVSHALRRYLARRLGVAALESTTTEIRRALAARDLPRETQNRLGQLLTTCDRIKFAAAPTDRAALERHAEEAARLGDEIEARLIDDAVRPPGAPP